jgi:putative MFS transporter
MGGVFSDGFGLGVIGISLSAATRQIELSPVWFGLIGAGSLIGLFAGALLSGPFGDRYGRRPIFAYNFVFLVAFSTAQFFVASATQWFLLRVMIGFVLGTDYVVSKTLLTEFTPRRVRGKVLSTLAIAWAAGYVCAYLAGYAFTGVGSDAWRWMLLAAAFPALVILPMRISIPESPIWLANSGNPAEAARVVREYIGPRVTPPVSSTGAVTQDWRWRQLLLPTWRRRTLVGCTFFTSQVVPYFAVGTFVSRVMSALRVQGEYTGGLVYNLFLLVGAVVGMSVVDRMPRRVFLLGSFAITLSTMLVLSVWTSIPSLGVVILFGVFAAVLSASQNLAYVYLPELFPTELRASGIGVAIAASRIGAAAGTFLLPVMVASVGVHLALGACAAALAAGASVCLVWAPETKGLLLGDARQQVENRRAQPA